MSGDALLLPIAVLAVVAFPIFAVSVYNWRDRRHSRRMNRRKTDQHRLL